MERRLTAILITDMVGYSQKMALDEAEIFSRQKQLRTELIDVIIREYGGQIVKSTGDGILTKFNSVVDAVRCAVTLQLEISKHEINNQPSDRIVYRIGINLGDIIVDDDDIHGDGVNLAARLVQVAEPGGICVAETVFRHVRGRISSQFEDLGEQDLKNIPGPVRAYRVNMSPEERGGAQESLQLGAFKYDPVNGLITGAQGEIVHLRKQSQKVLSILAETPGEIVTKDRLINAVWPSIATTDDSLIQCIADIRRTFGTQSVETFPKKGYRLCPAGADVSSGTFAISHRLIWLSLACLLIAATISLLLIRDFEFDSNEAAVVLPTIVPENTLAVLPFTNLSGDSELTYFSDGLSEDLTTDLSKVSDLTVISYASSFEFHDAEKGFRKIADDLGARYLVRGTVRHHADRVRINVSLIDPYEGFNLWAERFDRSKENPFDVQEEVARYIVEALSLELGAVAVDAKRIEPDAYYMLLRGLEPLRTYSESGNLEAREYFERALELDPEYARAHASIAITFGREVVFRYADDIPKDSVQKGLQAAITAIGLDPGIPDAYFALGVLNLALGEYDNALAAARHSIRLDKNYSDGYALLAEVAVHGGDLTEALTAIQRAKLLHPRYPVTYDWVEGHTLFQMGRYDDAQPILEKVADINPRFYRGLVTLAANYGQQGNRDAASDFLSRAQSIKPNVALDDVVEQASYGLKDRAQRLSKGLKVAGLVH
ncbi:MAG: tetratricopeptide repeat protein [Boseongicola sp.]